MKQAGRAVIVVLCLLAGTDLRADIPFFWLDKPTGRNNPNDPSSHLYVAPTAIYPSNTPSPFVFGTPTATPSASPSRTTPPSNTASPSSTPPPSATRTPSPAGTLSNTPTQTQTRTPAPSNTVSPTRTPASCPANFSFESGAQGWTFLNTGDTAVTAAAPSSAQTHCGAQSLALTVNLQQSPAANQGGQAILDGAGNGFPMDLSCKLITAWIYVPAGMSDASNPTGAFLAIHSGATWDWNAGTWVNLPAAGGWTQLTLDTSAIANANVTQRLLVKVSLGGASPAWAGTVYLDDVQISAQACGSPTNTPTASPSPTPGGCAATYSFESGVQGWQALTTSEMAVTAVGTSSVQAHCGQSLAMTVNLQQSPAANQGGQAYITGAGFPMDLSCKKITAWIYAPAGMSDASFPTGAFLYAFTGAGWTWTQGTWANLPNAGGWTQLSLDLANVSGADQVQQIGVKVAVGAGSLDFAGTLYLDEVDITASPCGSPTYTLTPSAFSPTPTFTRTPMPSCPLLPYAGLSQAWYTGVGTLDLNDATLAPTGHGGAWDTNIVVGTTNPHTPGTHHLSVTLPWTGYAGVEGYNWGGWYEPNASPPYQYMVDTTQFDSFEFWIRGHAGGEDAIAVRLMDGAGASATTGIVNISAIVGPLSTSYQKVVIPLCWFNWSGVDPSKIWEVDFMVDSPATDTGTMGFDVDDGAFVKYQASMPTATATPTPGSGCTAPSGSPVNEVTWWNGMPPAAQVWASAGSSFTQDNVSPHTPGNNYMVWTAALSGYYAGGSINWANWNSAAAVDATQFDTFEFWVRGAAGGEPLTIGMGFTDANGASSPVIPLAAYMAPLTTAYQLVKVPLCAFNFAGVDKTQLWQIDLGFGGAASATYTVYVDDGYFRKY